ncbi:MAG: NAD(P)-binding domain-containing protein [bacterium]|nr:NAD(P)-binding domain-containing protein [bacterium]
MSWIVLIVVVVALGLALRVRRDELRLAAATIDQVADARARGSAQARLQYPHIDLSRCIGCASCVAACPEEGVLDIVHGQALVVHGARCVGHGSCAVGCPVGALTVTLGDLLERSDIPVLTEAFESPLQPGLFLAGEVTGYALIRTAITHGSAVAAEVARRAREESSRAAEVLDLCIVGVGPAGLACALEAQANDLDFVALEQEDLGGTVSRYPRRKLVMTQPVELPLHGRLAQSTYVKEELIELWESVAARLELPIRTGQVFVGIERAPEGHLLVRTQSDVFAARHVCLALGRRGTPRKLGIPGEDLSKVAYSLIDAQSLQGRRVLVVGGGDSAIEAALGLAQQPGNEVTLSYRRGGFFRIKSRNEVSIARAIEAGTVRVLFESQVERIAEDRVELAVGVNGSTQEVEIGNDDVFVLAGGVAPFDLLKTSGVSFDPQLRPAVAPLVERGTGLRRALLAAFGLGLVALAWTLVFSRYYSLPVAERPGAGLHGLLRPSGGVGLAAGVLAALSMVANLLYLARRSEYVRLAWGSLRAWMTSHVATGLAALMLALVHSAMAPRPTVGGHALLGLVVLIVTGSIGRYFYSFVPRAANGRELALDEARAQLAGLASAWDRTHRAFGEHVRAEVQRLVASGHWTRTFFGRLGALVGSQSRLRDVLTRLRAEGRREEIAEDQLDELLDIARRAHRAALMASHYEDVRGLLATWRYLHRWVALLVVLLVITHVFAALRYSTLLSGGLL